MSNFDLFTHQSTGELDFLAIDLVIAMKTAAYHLATSFLSQYITVSMILTSIDLVFGIHFDLTLAFGRLVLPSLMALPRTTAANHWFTAAQLTVSILLLAVPLRQLGFGAGILIVGSPATIALSAGMGEKNRRRKVMMSLVLTTFAVTVAGEPCETKDPVS